MNPTLLIPVDVPVRLLYILMVGLGLLASIVLVRLILSYLRLSRLQDGHSPKRGSWLVVRSWLFWNLTAILYFVAPAATYSKFYAVDIRDDSIDFIYV